MSGARRAVGLLRDGRLFPRYERLITVRQLGAYAILNYTNRAAYGRSWDDVTMACRGLVVDTRDWSIAAWPLPKFFNLGERPETQLDALPREPFEVTEKIDGSLGVGFRCDGEFRITTRGALDSSQGEWATKWARQHLDVTRLPENYTPLFEIVWRDNETVLTYDWEGLVLLAVVDRWTGRELDPAPTAELLGVPLVRRYQFGSVAEAAEAAAALPATEEGYVVRFKSGLRVKLKGRAYLDLHRLYFGLTNRRIAEAAIEGTLEDYLARLPEELRAQAEAVRDRIAGKADELRREAVGLWRAAPKGTRKEYAIWVQGHARPELHGPLFQLLDGSEVDWVRLAVKLGAAEEGENG